MTRGALLGLALLLGCAGDGRKDLPVQTGVVPSLVPVLTTEGQPVAVGAIVRTTARGAILVAAPGADRPLPDALVVVLGGERVEAVRGSLGAERTGALAVVEVPRGERDLRPIGPARAPGAGDLVRVVSPGTSLVVTPATVETAVADQVRLLPLPRANLVDGRSPEVRCADACGAAVLAADGALVGFVTGADEDRALVTPITSLTGLLEAVTSVPGPDVLAGEDEAATLGVRLARVDGLPTIDDEEGAPDLFLSIRVAERPLPLIPLWEPHGAPLLVRTGEPGPVVVRLVERDVTLGGGDAPEDLADPAELDALYPGQTTIPFTLLRSVVERHPETRRGPLRTRVTLDVTRVDPEARSGSDRTPLGAKACALGRVGSGRVDLAQGDGSDFWAVDGEAAPRPAVLVLLRREPHARVAARAYTPGFEALRDLAPEPGAWLAVTRMDLPPGRTFVRVAALGGPATTYQLLVAPADDLPALVRGLFRLVARAVEHRLPYLGTREFAREVAVGLTFGAGLDPDALARAILPEVGHRTPEVRTLALNLLEAHFHPPPALVEEALAAAMATPGPLPEARPQAPALDLRLVAASTRRTLLDDDASAIADLAVRDTDTLMKLRALHVLVRVEDPALRARLTRSLEQSDPSGLVRKARQRLAP